MTSYLTANEIEELAESLVRKFYGRQQKTPQAVDIDGFVTDFLKLPIAYHSFAETDSDKIGFIADGVTPLRIYQNGAKPVIFPKGTIVLEKALLNPREEKRRRFTLAHEASHYFYPKDNTPGCTKQACGFGELYPQFRQKGAVVIGVSKDSVKSHENFAAKYELPFTLLSDPELTAIKAYDVWQEKRNYGKVSMGVVRTTYLINEEGIIEKAFGNVKAAENPQMMLGEL